MSGIGGCLDREACRVHHDLAGGEITAAGATQNMQRTPAAACSKNFEPLTADGQFNGIACASLRCECPRRCRLRSLPSLTANGSDGWRAVILNPGVEGLR